MALVYKNAVSTVPTPGGDIVLRGLNVQDIGAIVSHHKEDLVALFAKVTGGQTDLSLDDADAIAAFMLEGVPAAAAEIIARAANDPDNIETAMSIPFPVQLVLLDKIGELTFAMEGGAKKAVEIVVRMLQGVTATVNDLRSPA